MVTSLADNRTLITGPEAAEVAGTTVKTLVRWSTEGRFPKPFYAIGGRLYWVYSDLDRWLKWEHACSRAKRNGDPLPEAPLWTDPEDTVAARRRELLGDP